MITLGKRQEKEDTAYILDYLHYGRSDDSRPMYQKKPLIQAIGEKHFVLIDLIPKETVVPNVYDKVYIGDGDRPVIDHVKRRIAYNELTHGAQLELPSVIEKLIAHRVMDELKDDNIKYRVFTTPMTTRR